jgi:hypothetical protein
VFLVNENDYEIFVTYDAALKGLKEHGNENIGLDSVYKFTKYRHPMWIIVYRHKKSGSGVCAGFCFASSKEAKHVKNFMTWMKEKVEAHNSTPDEPFVWSPIVMIDRDEAERKGLSLAGFLYILCNFHSTVEISQKLNQLIKDPTQRQKVWEMVKLMQRSKTNEEFEKNVEIACQSISTISTSFWQYLNENWLCKRWRIAFCDILRKNLEGLWNTNNFTESQIKFIGTCFLKRKKCQALYILLQRIVRHAIPAFIKKIAEFDHATRPKINPTERSINRRMERGRVMSLSHKVSKNETGGETIEYFVKSATSKKGATYIVQEMESVNNCQESAENVEETRTWWHCNCRFWFWSGKCCKHIFAVLFFTESELVSDIRRHLDTANSSVPLAPRPGRPENLEKAVRKVSREFTAHKKTGAPSVPKIFMDGEGPIVFETPLSVDDSSSSDESDSVSSSSEEELVRPPILTTTTVSTTTNTRKSSISMENSESTEESEKIVFDDVFDGYNLQKFIKERI